MLRYGGFYGPGTGLARGGEQLEMIRKRRFPLAGEGRAVWSLVHIDDAAAATVAALERAKPATIYNIVDDEPSRVGEVLPYLAEVIGAKPPWRIPLWLARLLGEHMVVMMDEVRGASNAKARRELGQLRPRRLRRVPGRQARGPGVLSGGHGRRDSRAAGRGAGRGVRRASERRPRPQGGI